MQNLGLPINDMYVSFVFLSNHFTLIIYREIDHVCYRCETIEEYSDIKRKLSEFGEVLVEGMIGGRPILTLHLTEPILYDEHWRISCLEVPCPKPGRAYVRGLEHVEVVLCAENSENISGQPSFVHSRGMLEEFVARHPGALNSTGILFFCYDSSIGAYYEAGVEFDCRAIKKEINADVSVSIREGVSVKYHARPLHEVCRYELQSGQVVPVPEAYFSG